MKVINVMTKARKHLGTAYPAQSTDYMIGFNADKSITIFRKGDQMTQFRVGDEASYGSYNLIYTGEITKISDKTVTIVAYKGHKGMEQTHRLDLNEFCWRNYDFCAARVAAENQDTMMYI